MAAQAGSCFAISGADRCESEATFVVQGGGAWGEDRGGTNVAYAGCVVVVSLSTTGFYQHYLSQSTARVLRDRARVRQRARRLLHLLEALRLHPLPHRLRIRPRPVPKTPLAQTISPTAVQRTRVTGQGTLVAAYEKDFSRPATQNP